MDYVNFHSLANYQKKTIIKLFFIVFFVFVYLFSFTNTFAATYYVDSSITDTNVSSATPDCTNYNPSTYTCSGGASSAYKTIADVNAKTFLPGDYILFKKGDTWYGTIDPMGSGNSTNPITYSSYGSGAKPIITGFTTITSDWTNEGGGIYSKVINAPKLTNMVLLDDVQQTMGRYPNAGTRLTYESANTNISITDNQLTGTPNWTGAEIVLFKTDWEIIRGLVSNHTSNTISYTNYVWNGFMADPEKGSFYFIQNDLRTLDSLGEWYHDTTSGKFYMYFGGVDPNTKVVKVATVENLLKDGSGVDYITVDGLYFIGSISESIKFGWQNNYTIIQNCDVLFSGTTGIFVAGISVDINNNYVDKINGAGIIPVGSSPSVTHNTIMNQGLLEGQGSLPDIFTGGITLSSANNAYVANNIIENVAYSGIYPDKNSNTGIVIKNNYIKNACLLRQDLGGIYTTGADIRQVGVLFEGNVIIDSLGEGIYLDKYSTNVTVKDNIVSGSGRGGIFLNMANGNTITGNTLYNNEENLKLSNWFNENNLINNIFTGNKIIARDIGELVLAYTNWYSNYTAFFNTNNFNNNYYARPIDDNKTISTNLVAVTTSRTLAEWQTLSGLDINSQKSPVSVSSVNDIVFEYNATSSNRSVSLSEPMIDVAGAQYTGSVTLLPYTSIVLMPDTTTPAPDTTKPTISSFTIPSTSTSLTVSISTFSATDNVGVTGYILTESSTAPSAGSGSWASTAQTSYTFTTEGTKTLYAWAKDSASNVSLGSSDQVTITLPVVTAPSGGGGGGGGGSSTTTTTTTTPSTPTCLSTETLINNICQPKTTLSLIEKAKAKDVKVDGIINILDFNIVMVNWNKTYPTSYSLSKGDLTGDGIVNIFDMNQIMVYWGIKY